MSVIELELPSQQYEQLVNVAHARKQPLKQVAQTAVAEWLERQPQLEQARAVMRELGRGLGESKTALHNAADQHDKYLYSRAQHE